MKKALHTESYWRATSMAAFRRILEDLGRSEHLPKLLSGESWLVLHTVIAPNGDIQAAFQVRDVPAEKLEQVE